VKRYDGSLTNFQMFFVNTNIWASLYVVNCLFVDVENTAMYIKYRSNVLFSLKSK
jgi:hypothetical protein